jgi:DNA-binding NarL/FixJ family response regulator
VPISVVLAEDNVLLRDGLQRLIASIPDLELAGACGSLDELLALVERTSPDVVVTDIRMPPTSTDEGIKAAASIRHSHPGTGVVVLSQFASPEYALALLAEGSERRAYLLKDRVADVDDLVEAIRAVHDGGAVIDPKVVEQLVGASSRRPRSPLDHLTPRETEILSEMARGKSNASIAATLIVSERAVEKHINSIFSKLHLTEERDVNRRVTAVLLYLGGRGDGRGEDDRTKAGVPARFTPGS